MSDIRCLTWPENWCSYLFLAFLGSLLIRFVLSVMRASERYGLRKRPFEWKTIGVYFLGFGFGEMDKYADEPDRGGNDDYLQPLVLGTGELCIFPILLAANFPEFVGAWLGLKVLPRLLTWTTARQAYQRFLIGNALVLVFSYGLLKCFLA